MLVMERKSSGMSIQYLAETVLNSRYRLNPDKKNTSLTTMNLRSNFDVSLDHAYGPYTLDQNG